MNLRIDCGANVIQVKGPYFNNRITRFAGCCCIEAGRGAEAEGEGGESGGPAPGCCHRPRLSSRRGHRNPQGTLFYMAVEPMVILATHLWDQPFGAAPLGKIHGHSLSSFSLTHPPFFPQLPPPSRTWSRCIFGARVWSIKKLYRKSA